MKDAKVLAGQFGTDIEASKGGTIEESEDVVENEDEKDQAKVFFCSSVLDLFYSIILLSFIEKFDYIILFSYPFHWPSVCSTIWKAMRNTT